MIWPAVFPPWLALVLYIAVPAGVVCAIHAQFRRFIPPDKLIEHHEVAGFLIAVIGVLYSVVLGFLVAAVWTAFGTAQQTSDLEAGFVADAFGYAYVLPEPQRTQVQRSLANYAVEVHDVEWPMLTQREEDPRARALLLRAVGIMIRMRPARGTPVAEAIANASNRDAVDFHIRSIGDQRRLRISQARSRIPGAMYEALLLGGAMLLLFSFFFGVPSWRMQVTMTALLAGSIGLFFGLVIELSTPYAGPIRVSPDAWAYVIQVNHFRDVAK